MCMYTRVLIWWGAVSQSVSRLCLALLCDNDKQTLALALALL